MDDVVVVVPVPHGEAGRLVTRTSLDGEPVLVHTVRCALATGAPGVVTAAAEELGGVADVLSRAGLGRVPVLRCRPVPLGGLAAAVAEGLPASPAPRALLVHDPLCPLAPVAHLVDVLERARRTDGSYTATAAVHPVTDTVKTVHQDDDGLAVAGTVDREALRTVSTPVVVPDRCAALVTGTEGAPELVERLREHVDVTLVPAPPLARRVHDASGVQLVLGLRDVQEHRRRT